MTARGFAGPSKNFSPPGEFEQIGDALHRRRRRIFAEQPDDRVRMADAGQAPGGDQPFADETLEDRADMIDKGRVEGHPACRIGPGRKMVRIGYDIRMQEEQIEMLQAQPVQARFDRPAQQRLDIGRPRLAEIAFAGDPHACRQFAVKSRADNLLRFAVAVARGEVEEVDAGRNRCAHGSDAFLETGLAPQHPEAAAAQGQGRDRRQSAERMVPHQRRLRSSRCCRPMLSRRLIDVNARW